MQKKKAIKSLLMAAALSCYAAATNAAVADPQPVLVELFTSEGCSSCPPADKLLSALRRTSPNVIVLGEHVDYWNSLGWKDPFSSREFTERQLYYCQKLGVSGPYTPQAVIDGKYECLGSDEQTIRAAIADAGVDLSVPVSMQVRSDVPSIVSAKVSFQGGSSVSDILFFLVQDGLAVDVASGENGGRHLRHDGVVRMVRHIHNPQDSVMASADFPLSPDLDRQNIRVVAVIEDANGPCGAAQKSLESK